MNDVHEFCTVENLFVFLDFDIGTYESAHPVVCDDH